MIIIFFLLFPFLIAICLILLKENTNSLEITTGVAYVCSLILFSYSINVHDNPYYRIIDPVAMECYSPFSEKHTYTLIVYFFGFNVSAILVWSKNSALPPLTRTISLVFILIGVMISSVILYHLSVHDTESLGIDDGKPEQLPLLLTPLLTIIIGISLLYRTITQEIDETVKRSYSNKYLNYLNTFLYNRSKSPFWILLLLFPVFVLTTLILILFGQDIDSITKVFTDTTTWKLSQQKHPPILNHNGHYLCTVAAKGNPSVVKPIRIGTRYGHKIIVNRQLLVANAFEELIQDHSPKLHSIIRNYYDIYGFNLSKRINTVHLSNITYLVMKPLEFLFLVCLYLFCTKPEEKINKQYPSTVLPNSRRVAIGTHLVKRL